MLDIEFFKRLPPDGAWGVPPLTEKLFETDSASGFVPRVGDTIRHDEMMWPVVQFIYFPARVSYGKFYKERASVLLGEPTF